MQTEEPLPNVFVQPWDQCWCGHILEDHYFGTKSPCCDCDCRDFLMPPSTWEPPPSDNFYLDP